MNYGDHMYVASYVLGVLFGLGICFVWMLVSKSDYPSVPDVDAYPDEDLDWCERCTTKCEERVAPYVETQTTPPNDELPADTRNDPWAISDTLALYKLMLASVDSDGDVREGRLAQMRALVADRIHKIESELDKRGGA